MLGTTFSLDFHNNLNVPKDAPHAFTSCDIATSIVMSLSIDERVSAKVHFSPKSAQISTSVAPTFHVRKKRREW